MKTLKATVLVEGFFHLKAPRWHAHTLWMSCTVGCKVYCLDLTEKAMIDARQQLTQNQVLRADPRSLDSATKI